MASERIDERVSTLLREVNAVGGYPASMVCLQDGLVIAAVGDDNSENTAAVVSLFEDVLVRAVRDLGFVTVDEVSLLDPGRGRTVIRPLPIESGPTVFLVVRVPPGKTWRRNTNILRKQIAIVLAPLLEDSV